MYVPVRSSTPTEYRIQNTEYICRTNRIVFANPAKETFVLTPLHPKISARFTKYTAGFFLLLAFSVGVASRADDIGVSALHLSSTIL